MRLQNLTVGLLLVNRMYVILKLLNLEFSFEISYTFF